MHEPRILANPLAIPQVYQADNFVVHTLFVL